MFCSFHIVHKQGAIITGLQNRFKEFRRDRKGLKPDICKTSPNATVPSVSKKPEAQQSPSISWMQPPPVPVGEDECSFERFCSQLRDEAKRKAPRREVIAKLMEATYAQRRQDILKSPTPIPQLLTKYPLLADEDEVCRMLTLFLYDNLLLYFSKNNASLTLLISLLIATRAASQRPGENCWQAYPRM